MKEFFSILAMALVIGFIANNFFDKQLANIVQTIPTPSPELCENHEEVEDFKKPIPIVWTARIDDCLVSCEGAAFTRVPKDEKHPRFVGYYTRGLRAELEHGNHTLKISGDWVGVGADHFRTVFNNKCVPIINIKKIELTGGVL